MFQWILGDKNEEKEKEVKQEFSQTCEWIKKRLGEKVARVDISNRLSTSPCVLVTGKFGWSANMERLVCHTKLRPHLTVLTPFVLLVFLLKFYAIEGT